jgi:dihydroorotase
MPERRPRPVVLRGGTVIDATGERRADVVIEGGLITAVTTGEETPEIPRGARVLDSSGCFVAPGLVDLHTHCRQPGAEESETVESAARSAALGGFTAIVAMPNTDPPIDSAAVAREVLDLGAGVMCRVCVAGAITVGRAGERLAPMAELAALGVRIFTDDGTGVQDAGVMRRAMDYAHGLGVTVAQHCEDNALASGGHMHEGAWSSRLGVQGIPAEAEQVMASRDIALSRLTGARLHLLHVSAAETLRAVASAKADGLPVTIEVTPHHLALTDAALRGYDPLFKVNPPLRTPCDVMALRSGCATGIVDAIATDHAPHPPESKDLPLAESPPGMLGLETALAVCMGSLMHDSPRVADGVDYPPEKMNLRDIIGLMSWGPARIAGVAVDQGGDQGGPVAAGMPANLCVIDPDETWTVDADRMSSRSRNTPFDGVSVTGKVRHTIYLGEPVVTGGKAER